MRGDKTDTALYRKINIQSSVYIMSELAAPCSSPGCQNTATLACPTCLKLGIPPSRFCSQECFKNNWSTHKQLHALVKSAREDRNKDPTSIPTEFDGFNFTGPLRPCQKSARRIVPPHISRPDYAERKVRIFMCLPIIGV